MTATSDSRITVPASVTIPAGQSGAIVYISLTDNDVLDDESTVTVSAEGNGYAKVSQQLFIEDNEYPNLTVVASKSVITEGETFQLTITASRASAAPLTVTLTSENNKRFTFPQTLTIPAGETSTTVTVETVDDELPSLELSNAFTASAPSYNKGEVIVLLQDNDMPVLELTLTPNTVSEGVGPVAVAGVLRRTANTNSKITVKLADDANGGLYFGNRTLELAKGVQEVHFNFGPIDNAQVDGDRTYTITAAVWLSSCSCNASGESAGYVTAKLNVLDNDGPALSLSSSLSTVKEGDVTTLTISRNTTDTTTPLIVNISSDYDEGLTYDHTVTIPIGQQYVEVNVASGTNGIQGDSHTVVFTVQAEGYSTGTCYVMVTDQTLPDARITSINLSEDQIEACSLVKVEVTISNDGVVVLPEIAKVLLYVRELDEPIGTIYTQEAIAPGHAISISKMIEMPNKTGVVSVYAVINESCDIEELNYMNNSSENISINLLPKFSAIVNTDKKQYQKGEPVVITGKANGPAANNTEVEVYVINEGLRQDFVTTSDANGEFSMEWNPYSAQMGHFSVGACYPGEGLTIEQTGIDIFGLKSATTGYLKYDILLNEPYSGGISVINPMDEPLSNLKVRILSLPQNYELTFSDIGIIEAHQTVNIPFVLIGKELTVENKWEEAEVEVYSDNGATLSVPLYLYCRAAQGLLKPDIANIQTTMIKGESREYSFNITNIGKGSTGSISLSLPSWMKSATSSNMASLNQGETTRVVLLLSPTDEMQLNVPVTGKIGVNCENGEGFALPFNIEPVSDKMGTLLVDVCDIYTFNTPEAPHVADAKIVLKHPTTGEVIAQGISNEKGLFECRVQEGYYTLNVSADKHDGYSNYIVIDPGKETNKTIVLDFQAISVNWQVEETEVEDVYDIVTVVNYETNVPMPVVLFEGPNRVDGDAMRVGETKLLYFTLTNKGLISAQDITFEEPEVSSEWNFQPLAYAEPFDLAPQESVQIPVLLTRMHDASGNRVSAIARSNPYDLYSGCMAGLAERYKYFCGTDIKENRAALKMAMRLCGLAALMSAVIGNGGGGSEVGSPNGGGSSKNESSSNNNNLHPNDDICDPEVAQRRLDALDLATSMLPGLGGGIAGGMNNGIDIASDDVIDNKPPYGKVTKTVLSSGTNVVVSFLPKKFQIAKQIYDWTSKTIKLHNLASPISRIQKRSMASAYGWIEEFDQVVVMINQQYHDYFFALHEIFGDKVWYEEDDETMLPFWNHLKQKEEPQNANLMKDLKPESVSFMQFESLVERINNSTRLTPDAANRINLDTLRKYATKVLEYDLIAQEKGYETLTDYFMAVFNNYSERLNSSSNSVCSSVTLKFEQTMTLTRPAFRGTLTVFNGNEETAMTNVQLNLVVKDEDGIVATDKEFEIHAEADGLEGFEGEATLPGNWTLDAKQTGKATVLFIPTKYAAPTEEKVYSFGGSIKYIDPFTELEVSRSLVPVLLTVKPLPDLELTYLMQRDVYGDDPLTIDVVEPMEPAEFALIINNKGYGEANNVRMQTEQPKIIDNEKGLFIDFNIKSSQVNGDTANLSFGKTIANSFDNIPAHSQAYAQWWLESSLLGHFTSYDVEATHITSYDNEDLSLLDTVTIHEMIHGFTVKNNGDKPLRGYLVNDIADADDMPDILYFTDATQQGVYLVKEQPQITRRSDTEYVLTVKAYNAGWNYGSVFDPTNGRQKLVKVIRGDGTEVNVDNVWQTDRTLRDGRDWLYENRLHFVGNMPAEGETFYLTFEPKPELELAVESYAGVPEENTVLKEQLTAVTVKFNKPIKADSFTTADITLNCQGEPQDVTKIVIEKVNELEYKLTLNETTLLDGYYVLTVQTAGIEDTEGFNGATGKQVSWIQYVDGMVALKVTASPVEGGTVTPTSGRFAYDSNVTLKATPAEGYDFVGWKDGDATISTDREFAYHLVSATELKALFSIKHYNVTIGYDPTQGTVEGAATGIYEHGTQLQLTAVPATDYEFDAWMIGDDRETQESSFILTVNRNMDVSALFKEKKDVPTCLQNIDGDALRINIEPLPLSNYMYITGNFKEIRNVFIYDIRGIKVLGEGNVQSGQGIYVGKLNKGIYYLQIATDRGVYRTKVLKK